MNDKTVDNDSLSPVNLPQLTHLQLDNCYLDNVDQIARFVNANTQLEDLSVIWVEQWTSFAAWHDFPYLTQLTINSDLDANPAVVQLVRHCPALKTLVHAPFESYVFSTLTKNLRECCPVFTSIHCICVEEALSSGESMSDSDYVLLMQASARLVHMELAVSNFQLDLGDQLARLHGNWLETVALTMNTGTAFSFSSVGKILQKCPVLVSFSLSHLHKTQSSDANAGLFLKPWQCPKLERIKLQSCVRSTKSALHRDSSDVVTTGQTSRGILDGTSGLTRAPDSDRDLEFLQKISQHGWRFDRDLRMVAKEMLEVDEVWALRDSVFERLLELPRMCSVSIEGYESSDLGHFIELFYRYDYESENMPPVFRPGDHIACLMVSKLWHSTLTPFLWAVYDNPAKNCPGPQSSSV
ncbi:hypothetical protein BGZ82_009023, partial [Podila clonocystis]